MTKILVLPLKSNYFYEIKAGTKLEEYRLVTEYWKKRLIGKNYDVIELCLGYPKKGDLEKRLFKKYLGYEIKTIQHPFFGPNPVDVFCINVSEDSDTLIQVIDN